MENIKKILFLTVGLLLLCPFNPTNSKNFLKKTFKKAFKIAKNPLFPSKKTLAEKFIKKAKKTVVALKQIADINTENFHTVKKGALYRSKQPSRSMLKKYKKDYNIKTIINLRGKNEENKKESWYKEEVQGALDLGLNLYHISMTAKQYPSKKNLHKLIKIYDQASLYPILIHCRGGADRTGEAAAIWLLLEGKSKSRALDELTFTYGHMAGHFKLKKKFISKWVDRHWALNVYDPNNL